MARDVLRRIRSHPEGWGRARGDSPPGTDRAGARQGDADSFAVLLHLSHEIRTPLNSMLALSQLLRDGLAGPLNGEQQKYVEVIERNGENLLRLVGDVLDLSRMKLDRVDIDLRPVDLVEQLRASVVALGPLAQEKNIALVVNAVEVPLVECDSERLRQILTNLIGNAIKFTERGQVKIETEIGIGIVVVHVCDTGVGIPEAAQSHVFDEFFQVGTSTLRRGTGLGLGLAITRRLVRLMGGDLSVESTEGVGSRFTFSLPMASPESRWSGTSTDREQGERNVAIGGPESTDAVGSATHRLQDEPHGSNTAG